jgi:hypothetical protein
MGVGKISGASTRANFVSGAALLLAGCAESPHSTLVPKHVSRGKRYPKVTQPVPGDPTPICSYVGQTNCIDPDSGLYVIGATQVTYGRYNLQADWCDATGMSFTGPTHTFSQSLAQCVQDSAGELVATAAAIANYLKDNWQNLASATSSLGTFAGVYLAGGATEIEFIGAAIGVLVIGDWAALLTTLGLVAYEVARVTFCVIQASQ